MSRGPAMLEQRDNTMRWERDADTARLHIGTEGVHDIDLTAGLKPESGGLVRLAIQDWNVGKNRVDVTLWPHEVRVLRDWLESLP